MGKDAKGIVFCAEKQCLYRIRDKLDLRFYVEIMYNTFNCI